jgi:Zn-dependent protease
MACFIIVTVLWIFSVCLHEFGHAIVAYRGGDTTVREKGYLTFNPLKYTHPVYSLLMPVLFMMMGGIGLPGGAVYIEHDRLRSRYWETAVSLAGPAMNLLLIVLLCLPFRFGWIDISRGNVVAPSLAFLIQLEISSVLLCLLPIPPLDGFRAISPWLPRETVDRLLAHSDSFIWGLFLILWYVPAANHGFWSVVSAAANALNIDSYLAFLGRREFQFWR